VDLDEVFIRIQGVQHYLWRAVDQDGVVLDILVQPRRDAKAAKRFFRQLLKGLQYVPRVIVTDKLRTSRLPPQQRKCGRRSAMQSRSFQRRLRWNVNRRPKGTPVPSTGASCEAITVSLFRSRVAV
jgi:transposase-like protein